jgi:hypothetical protein
VEKKYNWFRVYNSMVDNEKLRLLAFEDRWHFVAILCLTSEGLMDQPASDLRDRKIAVKLGLTVRECEEVKRRLSEVELVDQDFRPFNWDSKQFKSDSSSDRTREYRARKAAEKESPSKRTPTKRHSDKVETSQERHSDALDTDTDTDTDTDKEQKNSRQVATISPLAKSADADDYREFAGLMWHKIQSLTNQQKTPNIEAWADEIRKLVEIDRQPLPTAWEVFTWANKDKFWQGNILSATNFRKHFPKLYAQSRGDAPVDFSAIARNHKEIF